MTYVDAIRREADAFAAAAHRGFAPKVPGCPKWTVGDLTYHLGCVHRFHTAHLGRGVTTKPDPVEHRDPPDEELLDWFEEGVDELLIALRRTDPDLPAWNWAPHTPQVASFWSRRMALETAVHRWDAESAHGEQTPIDVELAVDGIDEVLAVHLPADLPDEPVDQAGTVLVRCTDADASWPVRLDRDRIELLAKAPRKPNAVLEGTASEVLLALWGRVPLSDLGSESPLAAALRTG